MEKLPVIYLGTENEQPPLVTLKAGTVNCIYQNGAIRQVSAGGREVLRMVYLAVRDQNWDTVPREISNEEIKVEKDSFFIRYDSRYTQGDISYHAIVRISGNSDNTVTFSIEGKALSRFRKNRIGLNVLHPVSECAGRACLVCMPSGEEYESTFPVFISPHQPMKNIRSLKWDLKDGVHAFLKFSGEVFEMEDQRNWTDASYKTYSTPLALPFPVTIDKGETMTQEICLKVEMKGENKQYDRVCRVIIPGEKLSHPFPAIGICRSSDTNFMHPDDMKLIGKVGFDLYRVDLELYRGGWREILGSGVDEAGIMGLQLELGLFFGGDHARELDDLVSETIPEECRVARILVFTWDHLPDDGLFSAVVSVLRKRFNNAQIGTGTNANFAELNRNWPDPDLPDFMTWSINPQVHAFDPLTLVENLEGQRDTILSGTRMAGDTPVAVSPVTLRPKFNVVATSGEDAKSPARGLPRRFDQRQVSLFCAGWTLGSIQSLAGAGAGSITYYETVGRGGIIHGRQKPSTPVLFPAAEGDIYPVYYLFRELLKFKNYMVIPSESSHPFLFSTFLLEGDHDRILCLANHTDSCLQIRWPDEMKADESWILDEHTVGELGNGEEPWKLLTDVSLIKLNPYAVSMVKTTGSWS